MPKQALAAARPAARVTKPRRPGLLRSPAVFSAGLVVALLAGFGIAKATESGDAATPAAASPAAIPSHNHAGALGTEIGGTSLSAGGFTMVPAGTAFTAGVAQPFTFRIVGADRKPVTDFITNQDRKLHLIVARHDLTGYQHLHPTMAPDGTWSLPLTLPSAGLWRAFADFVVTDPTTNAQVPITLAVDLTVPGAVTGTTLPAASRIASVDGYDITMEGTLQVGSTQPLTMRVLKAGRPVTDLQQYLGTYGHLVVLREGDLAYLHVHSDGLIDGGVKFWLAAPSSGTFRLYFQFQAADVVHTAEYTVVLT